MSIKDAPYYWVECDNCGERCEYDEFSAMSDPGQAVDLAVDSEWSRQGDRHHCPDCPVIADCEKCDKDAGELPLEPRWPLPGLLGRRREGERMSAMRMTTRTPLCDLLILMAGDAAMYRRPEPSTRCPGCSAATADRCDECADDEALAGEYDTVRVNLRAVTTDTAALIALAELVEQAGPEMAALLTGTESAA